MRIAEEKTLSIEMSDLMRGNILKPERLKMEREMK